MFDHTATAMGSRLLKRWINRPLREHDVLRARQESIKNLLHDHTLSCIAKNFTAGMADFESIFARVALKSARPRDLVDLRHTLACIA